MPFKPQITMVGLFLACWMALIPARPVHAEMDSGAISESLNRQAEQGATPQTLWNTGFLIFNEGPPTPQAALNISRGYQGAAGKTPEQNQALKNGANYWRNRHDQWKQSRVVGRESPDRDHYYRGIRGEWESNLPLTPPREGGASTTPRLPARGLWGRWH